MKRGFLLYQFKVGGVFRIFLLFIIGAGISGCGAMAEATPAKPVVCTPQATNVNIYRAASTSVPQTSYVVTPSGNSGASGMAVPLTADQTLALLQGMLPQNLPSSVPIDSYSVLGTLVNETRAWSDVQTVNLDDSNKAQIVVTFLSPQMIQAVFNSEVSSRGYSNSNPQPALDAVAAREELIFFVTVITTTNNNLNTTPHNIKIPIHKMVMVNTDDVNASPLHDDHILAQPINSSFEPVFGYLTYPIAMLYGADCSWILNPNYNKRIIVTVSDILVDEVPVGTYTWVIPFSSLIKTGVLSAPQTNIAIDPNLISSSFVPPSPMVSLLTPNGLPEATFWQIYAGFLWRQVMQGIY